MRKLTYYIAVSIDGFIGDPSGDATAFLPFVDDEFFAFLKAEYPETLPTHGRRPFGIDDLENRHFDTVIQGRASYDLALENGVTSPYAHLRQYVVSRSIKESPDPAVEIVSGDVAAKVRELKAEEGGLGIYLCGGADLAGQLTEEIDELIIKTYPLVLGSGMPMFATDFALSEFTLESVRTFGNGVLVRKYDRKP
ncbi:dihydrofolate reductase family protein [Streptomyces scopuliridis]|uniref:Deaminase n=1 Tax=Streptomyces scopuliridis RB72 TaxID=1440053 RepID=A0A2T7TEH1_9ACTN|nr:dihydrofolate reductase family protein [Streptomyces scopuliridis]PVE13497.1 deaminase [Streptomyces scopuliridis RB72]